MSVIPTQLRIYGAVNSPEADGATVGGAVDLTRQLSFSDMAANGTMNVVSSSASDTATKVQISGLDAAGIQQTPTSVTLNGQTKVSIGATVFGRLLYGALSGASATGPIANPGGTAAVGDVAVMANTMTITAHTAQVGSANGTGITPPLFKLQASDGASVALGMVLRTTGGTGPNQIRQICSTSGTGLGQYGTDIVAVNRDWTVVPDATTTYEVATGMVFEILPNPCTSVIRPLSGISADVVGGSARTYYYKGFVLNTNATTATTGMTLVKASDPGGLYSSASVQLDITPCTALNDTASATNRVTAPSGVGSYSSGSAPQSISLAAQSAAANTAAQAQGFWIRVLVGPGAAPQNTSYLLRTSGATT